MYIRHGLSCTLAALLTSGLWASPLLAQDVRAALNPQDPSPSVIVHQVTSIYNTQANADLASGQDIGDASLQADQSRALRTNPYTWDFNNGTWQGWTLVGKYRLGKIYVPRFTRYEGTFINPQGTALFTTPDVQGITGWSGIVMYHSVSLVSGVTYELSFDHGVPVSFQPSAKGHQSVRIDGTTLIPALSVGKNKVKFTATKTGPANLIFWNNTDSGYNNSDFYLDNITLVEDFIPT